MNSIVSDEDKSIHYQYLDKNLNQIFKLVLCLFKKNILIVWRLGNDLQSTGRILV
jgi:hypothetical protein